jgi:hypothetical protein
MRICFILDTISTKWRSEPYQVEFPGKEWGSAELGLAFVREMALEEFPFIVKCFANWLADLDISLSSVYNGNVAES